MTRLALACALSLLCLPAAAQDPERGKLLYENHCGGCHYERVHQRPPGRTRVLTLAGLQAEVSERAALTGHRFTMQDLEDVAEYLNRSHYRLTR